LGNAPMTTKIMHEFLVREEFINSLVFGGREICGKKPQ
jgi:hypothetical protein